MTHKTHRGPQKVTVSLFHEEEQPEVSQLRGVRAFLMFVSALLQVHSPLRQPCEQREEEERGCEKEVEGAEGGRGGEG